MNTSKKQFAVCIENTDYAASLIVRKIYEVLPDDEAAKDEFLRVIDESGEDYLYHRSHFVLVEFPAEVEHALTTACRADQLSRSQGEFGYLPRPDFCDS